MANHPLMQYVYDARRHGMDNRQIIQALSSAGWQVHEIMDVLLNHARLNSGEVTPVQQDNNIISVRNISKHYGELKALDNVSLSVNQGTVTALLGPNGAGKTTLVRILTTLLTPDAGQARVAGYDV